MTIYEAQQRLLFQLYEAYESREAANIADLVMEHITGWKKVDRILNKQVPIRNESQLLLEKYTTELLDHRPVQYVLTEAWFQGMKFTVNEHVLIPRPETEELVNWVVETISSYVEPTNLTILDIGTGSGCIAISLKKKLSDATILACDISKEALSVAQQNSRDLGAAIDILQLNFLDRTQWERIPSVDIIVSNPPYIPNSDANTMHRNVLDFEPHIALFVENDDPLIFYRAIAEFGQKKLNNGGWLFAEIHENFGERIKEVFAERIFENFATRRDLQGKNRMIRCRVATEDTD